MVVKYPAAMKIAFGENPKGCYGQNGKKEPVTRMAIAALLREQLFKAKRYAAEVEAAEKDPEKTRPFDMQLEALLPVIRKEIPLKAHAHRADDILTALRIAREFDVDITLDHVTEGHLIVDHLVKAGKPVLVGPSFGSKTKVELREKSFATPGILDNAGLEVCIITDAPVIPLYYLPLCAGLAVKAGMKEESRLAGYHHQSCPCDRHFRPRRLSGSGQGRRYRHFRGQSPAGYSVQDQGCVCERAAGQQGLTLPPFFQRCFSIKEKQRFLLLSLPCVHNSFIDFPFKISIILNVPILNYLTGGENA